MPLTVIIPSKNLKHLKECLTGVRESGFTGRILVMDDFDPGTNWQVVQNVVGNVDVITGTERQTQFIKCPRPFIFSRNVNIGIQAADDDDVMLLNDDAVVQNRGALDKLIAASEEDSIGAFSALIQGMAAAPDQVFSADKLGSEEYGRAWFPVKHHMMAFMAVLIPRRVLVRIGPLDVRFTGYGFEDDDYCLRLTKAGLGLAVVPDCLVEHGSLESTYRGQGRAADSDMLAENRTIFQQKWGTRR